VIWIKLIGGHLWLKGGSGPRHHTEGCEGREGGQEGECAVMESLHLEQAATQAERAVMESLQPHKQSVLSWSPSTRNRQTYKQSHQCNPTTTPTATTATFNS